MPGQQRHLWHVPEECLSPEVADELDASAATHWNTFYKQNKTKFFKDRHYLDREFPALASSNCTILEVGCGVGNTAYPLLELNPHSQVYACDFAPSAIELVKAHPQYQCGRMHAFVADITCDDLRLNVPPRSVDICTMVFVLSAITPAKVPAAVANVARVLQTGTGRVLVRDYAEGDLAQLRFSGSVRTQRLSHNFYVRSDGTQAYYFSQASLLQLFRDAGFTCQEYKVHERQIENRRQEVTMHRRWVQAVFAYTPDSARLSPDSSTAYNSDSNRFDLETTAAQNSCQTPDSTRVNVDITTDQNNFRNSARVNLDTAAAQTRDTTTANPDTTTVKSPKESARANLDTATVHLSDTGVATNGPQSEAADHAVSPVQQLQNLAAMQQPGVPQLLLPAVPDQSIDQPSDLLSARPGQNIDQPAELGSMAREREESASGRGRQEWEEGGTMPEQDSLTGCLFAEGHAEEILEEVELEPGGLTAQVISVSRQHQHTLEHTGLMCWQSCLPLARLLLAQPSLTQGKQVLEVGCGVNPLCCLAALRHCRRYIATDGSVEALRGLARNLDLNCRNVIMERARALPLAWGDPQQQAVIQTRYRCFDTIIGADVVYAPEAIPALFRTCKSLLSRHANAKLVLCHITRRVSEQTIIDAAAECGLQQAPCLPAWTDQMATISDSGPFRLLRFKHNT